MNNTVVMIDLKVLKNLVKTNVIQAQKKLIIDHIKPYSSKRAAVLLRKLEEEPRTKRRRTSPKEITVKVLKNTHDADYSEIEQYLVVNR